MARYLKNVRDIQYYLRLTTRFSEPVCYLTKASCDLLGDYIHELKSKNRKVTYLIPGAMMEKKPRKHHSEADGDREI